ncbi:RNA-directed DNA polymerase, eukaryota [Tanacetum coccineum]
MFLRLYSLENCKDCYVADKILSSVTTSFRRLVRGGPEAQQLSCLLEILEPVILSNMEDRWVWDMNGDGSFLDRLPTRLNLYRRGVVITSVECPNCGEVNEDTTHIFFNCGLALDVMHLVSVGGIWIDLLSVLIPTGSSGSKLFEWVQKRKTFWKGSFTLLGGAFGVTEIISCLRIRSLGKIIFLTM